MQERPKYWYEKQADMTAADRREFLRGYFGINPVNKGSIIMGILSGALIASAAKELRRR